MQLIFHFLSINGTIQNSFSFENICIIVSSRLPKFYKLAFFETLIHCHKKRKDSLETRAVLIERCMLCYVEIYRAAQISSREDFLEQPRTLLSLSLLFYFGLNKTGNEVFSE